MWKTTVVSNGFLTNQATKMRRKKHDFFFSLSHSLSHLFFSIHCTNGKILYKKITKEKCPDNDIEMRAIL